VVKNGYFKELQMAKKIMVLCGSPRKNGNTNTVVQWVAEGARSVGAEVEVFDVSRLNLKANGCIACMGCQKSDKYECVLGDDAANIVKRIPEFEVLVLASPIYWFSVSAQLKIVMDRMFSLIKFDPKTGEPLSSADKKTKMCLVATAGGDFNEGLTLTDMLFKAASLFMSCDYESLLVPLATMNPKEMADRNDIREEALALGKQLAE
jgi:multimeric flavodoxin WrbA